VDATLAGGRQIESGDELGCRILVVFKGAGFDFSFRPACFLLTDLCSQLALVRTLPQSHYHFLSNELLVDTIHCCYTSSVTSKRSSFLDSSLSELGGSEWNFVATILKDDTDDERSPQLSNR
jgi:hypothetical protein